MKKNIKKWILIIIAVLIVGALVIANLLKDDTEIVSIETEKVTRQTLVHKVNASGKIQPEVEIKISAVTTGWITDITVLEGDSVKMGQHLISLDDKQLRSDVERSQSMVKSAKADLRKRKARKERTEALYKKILVSKQELETDVAAYESAESLLEQYQASLESANDRLSKTKLSAPQNGIVTKVYKEKGEMALGSTFQAELLMTVADLSRMEVEVDVNENDVVSVSINDTAEIEIDAFQDTVFTGIVSEIAHVAESQNMGSQEQVTNFKVKVRMLNVPDKIRPGMSATANIITDVRKNALAVPIQCLTVRPEGSDKINPNQKGKRHKKSDQKKMMERGNDQSKKTMMEVVFTVADTLNGLDPLKKKERRYAVIKPVKVGITSDTHYEVLQGVAEGDEVVTGSYKAISRELKHGSVVTIN
ncbi:MAG: efflux RND transporter periplasmic adaptor subunit [Candidatus Marinimicrobia bacterium]|nr:efflux RND transporter periplasmic adaptor subunit [Candidatus Neomarinimicrobiota bacterium]